VGKKKINVSDINFFSIGNFNGNFNCVIDKLYFKDILFNKFLLKGEVQDRDINFKNISASGFNREIKANGYISTIRPVVMMKFGVGLGNVDPSLILEKLLN
jgi:hypothetical protein